MATTTSSSDRYAPSNLTIDPEDCESTSTTSSPRRDDVISPPTVETMGSPNPPSYSVSPVFPGPQTSKIRTSNPLFPESSQQRPSLPNEARGPSSETTLYAAPYPVSSPSANWDSDTPSCFSRGPPSHLEYPAFDSIYLISKGKHLDKGFPLAVPPLESHANHYLNVHPFVSHDVTETDWISFVHSIQATASFNDQDVKRLQPMLLSVVPVVGPMTAYGAQYFIRGQKEKKVIGTIEMWNRHFFGPRRMRIGLLKGREDLTPWNRIELAPWVQSLPKDQLYRLFVVSLTNM